MTFEMTLAEHLTMAASASMFSKLRILGVRVTIAQRKISLYLT